MYKMSVSPSGWGLPSICPFSIAAQTYLSMLSLEYSIHPNSWPALSPTGRLPALQVTAVRNGEEEKDFIGDWNNIANYVGKHFDRKYLTSTTESDRAEDEAFMYFIQRGLYSPLLYNWWIETENSSDTRYAWTKNEPFFVRFFSGRNMYKEMRLQLRREYGADFDEPQRVYERADEVFAKLSRALGNSNWFRNREHPTCVDACAFGFLSLHLYPARKNQVLCHLLGKYKNLVSFCERVRTSYFDTSESADGGVLFTQGKTVSALIEAADSNYGTGNVVRRYFFGKKKDEDDQPRPGSEVQSNQKSNSKIRSSLLVAGIVVASYLLYQPAVNPNMFFGRSDGGGGGVADMDDDDEDEYYTDDDDDEYDD